MLWGMKASLFFALLSAVALHAQPSIVPGGVLNAASFAKNSAGQGTPVAPGSLVAIFGSGIGASTSEADTIPYSTSLGGLTVSFNGVAAALQNVIPAAGIITAQVPFEALPAGQGTAQVAMAVTLGGQTANANVTVVPVAPGVFTLPSGVGYAVLVNLADGSVAAPGPTVPGGFTLTSHPIPRGQTAFFYATGLGAMTPTLADGAGINTVTTQVNQYPIVWIGGVNTGVMASIQYAGPSGYPGVYQVNITIPANAPTGNNVVFQVQSADGSQVSPATSSIVAIQ
jgi:uncharacterized protein (TIGR03437 family)